MEVKIIKASTPELLELEVNKYLEFSKKVKSINMTVGAFPGYAEFYAIILM